MTTCAKPQAPAVPAASPPADEKLVRDMLALRRATGQSEFVRAFLVIMGCEDDGVRVRLCMTWPRPKKKKK